MFSSMTMMLGFAALGIVLVGAVAMRLILAPENIQDRARLVRLKALQPGGQADEAKALVQTNTRSSIGRDLPIVGNLPLLVRRADMQCKVPLLIIAVALLGLVAGAALSFFMHLILALLVGLLGAAFIVRGFVKSRYRKRMDAMTAQLPDALDLMMRGLRVGHPINATIANVGRTMADPIGAEFRQLSEQVAHGDYLTDAFTDFAERVGQEDVEYLAVSINIQHGTGGNLAEMLGTLSKVVRDRIIMRRRIKAISSEGRISAWLLSALPVVIYLATSITAPDYYGAVSDDPMFKPIAFAIVALVVGNFLAMRKLVTFQL